MEELLTRYKEKQPEIVFEWHDAETGAEGWIVINSLRNGAAGGGTRMRKGLTREEVVSLAKVMEIKFSVCGPDIGGAKSGINFDPADPRRVEVLTRWYKAVLPILKNYYGTGGDLNVDELKDVVPITEDLGLWHPQEGIVVGHFKPTEGQKINIIGQLRYGCTKPVEDTEFVPEGGSARHAVADLITGYGVSESVRHYYDIFRHESVAGKTAIIQGWGNVASAAACYLAKHGVRVVGIIDREGGLIRPEGFSLEEVKHLFNSKDGNRLHAPGMLPFSEVNEKIWTLGAHIFIPGAASKLVTRTQVDALLAGGVEVIACGANVPFVDDGVFFGPTARFADEHTAVIPDFIANCGMARVFAYLMQSDAQMTDRAIFTDTSVTIRKALEELRKISDLPNNISHNALYLALKKLMAGFSE
ncbi:MAG: Glu/Leu/Phe/Val dehydrogenase dimerization domain-containing protein [Saprospiraceae bacterium]|nr:Glu/Leu/Phe/Val dehydrogenase dimerization domain-containing protein [Saprospiraceae bacterium]HNL38615.1 Glu/Leu/Phe/Val dehydrogenase dimerization domain-containing protein [Saprospiraceae bacterium]